MLYYYFDYKNQDETARNVVNNLLKQVVSKMHTVPPFLYSAYEDYRTRQLHPELPTVIEQLLSYCEEYSTVYIAFDAFDECAVHQQEDVFSLLEQFSDQPKCRIMLTSRPHLHCLQKLNDSAVTLPILADDSDIKIYISSRLSKEKFLTQSALKEEISDAVKGAAKGM